MSLFKSQQKTCEQYSKFLARQNEHLISLDMRCTIKGYWASRALVAALICSMLRLQQWNRARLRSGHWRRVALDSSLSADAVTLAHNSSETERVSGPGTDAELRLTPASVLMQSPCHTTAERIYRITIAPRYYPACTVAVSKLTPTPPYTHLPITMPLLLPRPKSLSPHYCSTPRTSLTFFSLSSRS